MPRLLLCSDPITCSPRSRAPKPRSSGGEGNEQIDPERTWLFRVQPRGGSQRQQQEGPRPPSPWSQTAKGGTGPDLLGGLLLFEPPAYKWTGFGLRALIKRLTGKNERLLRPEVRAWLQADTRL